MVIFKEINSSHNQKNTYQIEKAMHGKGFVGWMLYESNFLLDLKGLQDGQMANKKMEIFPGPTKWVNFSKIMKNTHPFLSIET